MPGGFGRSQPQRRGGKTALQEIRQLSVAPQPSVPEPDVDLAMQAEVEAFFTQYQQDHPEESALAWSSGVYNPLARMADTHARPLTPEEEDWLGLARLVGWLLVEDELEAIYFTAPPPDFAQAADWYLRPDLTSFLEELTLLQDVVQVHPIPLEAIQGAIAPLMLQLGWTSQEQKQFVQALFGKPITELTAADWEWMLLELQSRVEDAG